LLVIVRSLGEYFRLQYLHGNALVVEQGTGALFAAVALAVTMICYVLRLYRIFCHRRDAHCATHLQCGLRR
jgi:hypothetical protein